MGLIRKLLTVFSRRTPEGRRILRSFQSQRQDLQHEFFRRAAESGKPRGLRWSGCEWLSTLALVHDKESQLFTLFCGVNLTFEAIEGGDMEDVEAVSTVRDGSAVFHNHNGRWGTGGRVLFNMPPETAAHTVAPGQSLLLTE